MEQLDDMHEFENDAIRKANLIKEGKRRIVKKTAYLMRGMSFRLLTNSMLTVFSFKIE